MKKSLVLLALASALPLAAQSSQAFEVSALYTWNKPKSGTFSGGGNNYDLTPDTWKAAGIRFGYTFAKVSNTEFQGNATYQFNNTQDYTLKLNGVTAPVPPGTFIREDYKYWAVGAAASWATLPVRLSAGLEYRSEKLDFATSGGVGAPDNSVTYGRVWVRGNAGYDFKTSSAVTPFVAVEFALPLTSTSPDYNQLSSGNWESLSKGVAPKFQYGINVGVRF